VRTLGLLVTIRVRDVVAGVQRLRTLRGPRDVLPKWRAALPRPWNLLLTIWLYLSLAYTAAVLFAGVGVTIYPVHFALMFPS
jgi:hypothetical protein